MGGQGHTTLFVRGKKPHRRFSYLTERTAKGEPSLGEHSFSRRHGSPLRERTEKQPSPTVAFSMTAGHNITLQVSTEGQKKPTSFDDFKQFHS